MGLLNRAKYFEVTFCRIEVSTDADAGMSYDPNTYVPAQIGPDGTEITPAQGLPPSANSGGAPEDSISVTIHNIPGNQVINLFDIAAFHRYFNPKTLQYENNVVEVYLYGLGLKYIRINPLTLENQLLALNLEPPVPA